MTVVKRTKAPVPANSAKAARVVAGLAAIAIIFFLASYLSKQIIPALENLVNPDSFAQTNAVTKVFMLLFSLSAIWWLKRSRNISFGFTKGDNLNYKKFTKQAILLGLAGLFSVIILNVIGFAINKKAPVGFPDEHILARIFFIWILSSVAEEVLFRGLFQSLISDLKQPVFHFRNATISLAVLLSALSFAALHLTLLLHGMGGWFVAGIFVNTLLLGFLAGYLRERTASLYPAIYVHIVFNIVGSIPILLKSLF